MPNSPSVSPNPTNKVLSDLKASILNPALTSHFQCWFNPPSAVIQWTQDRAKLGLGEGYNNREESISLSCSEAALPGTSLATHTLTNDHMGITERHAYRRQYDTTSSFTFYVDKTYEVLYFFENWIAYIVNEDFTQDLGNSNYFYRVNFPRQYQTTLHLKKFEKDYAGQVLKYSFLNASPLSINSIPVTYGQSELLKCVVNFNFSRYVVAGLEYKDES